MLEKRTRVETNNSRRDDDLAALKTSREAGDCSAYVFPRLRIRDFIQTTKDHQAGRIEKMLLKLHRIQAKARIAAKVMADSRENHPCCQAWFPMPCSGAARSETATARHGCQPNPVWTQVYALSFPSLPEDKGRHTAPSVLCDGNVFQADEFIVGSLPLGKLEGRDIDRLIRFAHRISVLIRIPLCPGAADGGGQIDHPLLRLSMPVRPKHIYCRSEAIELFDIPSTGAINIESGRKRRQV